MVNIIYEDKYILVCEKPAGIAVQAGKVTEKDMMSEVNNYLASSCAYLIHRLDKPVRGILVFAKTKDAAAKLNAQLTNGGFNKHYYALVEGRPDTAGAYGPDETQKSVAENGLGDKKDSEYTILENLMYKDSKLSKSIIVPNNKNLLNNNSAVPGNADIKHAILEYKIIPTPAEQAFMGDFSVIQSGEVGDVSSKLTLLDVHLITGRFHQIRCQLSNIGCPIVGDSLYGAKSKLKNRKAIGLIAYSLEFTHPYTNKQMQFTVESDF